METVPAKHLLQKTRSPAWFGAACNLDLYRGCCHVCIHCDSRSDDCDRVRAKENAIPPAAAGAGGQAADRGGEPGGHGRQLQPLFCAIL